MTSGTILWAVTCVAAAMLVIAGVPKATGRASVPMLPPILHRPLGTAEVLVGTWALVAPTTTSALAVGLAYTLLALSLLVAILRREPDCGCFGVEPVPPEWGHLGINVVLTAAALAAAASSWARPAAPTWIITAGLAFVSAAMLAEVLSTGAELRRLRDSLEANR